MKSAVKRGDLKSFERHAAHVQRLFDYLLSAIAPVADRWEYGVNAAVKFSRDAMKGHPPEHIRHHLYYVTVTGWEGRKIYNYYRSDRYELIRDVYRPIWNRYIENCRKHLQAGEKGLPEPQGYKDIIKKYVVGPCPPPPPCPDMSETAWKFLSAIDEGKL
jgi:hypothetical protein